MQNVRVDRRLLAPLLRPAAESALKIVQANVCLLVIGISRACRPLAGIDKAATIESEIRQAVKEKEFAVGISLGQVPCTDIMLMDVIGITYKPDVRFALMQTQGFGHS